MSNDPFAALPAAQRHIAHTAITAVLGAAAIATVRPILGGVSGAFVFLIEAGGRRFVLRIEGPASPFRNPHQYFSMRIAAEAGIAPRLHYLDADDRVVIMDFIEDRPLENYPGGRRGLARAIGAMLKELQTLPLFHALRTTRTLSVGCGPRAKPDASLSAPTFAEFERAIREGRLLAETPETSHALGKMFLASFLSGAAPPGLPPMYMR